MLCKMELFFHICSVPSVFFFAFSVVKKIRDSGLRQNDGITALRPLRLSLRALRLKSPMLMLKEFFRPCFVSSVPFSAFSVV